MPYKNREDKNACQRRYANRHRDRQREFWNNWYHKNKEKESIRIKNKRMQNHESFILKSIRNKAKREGREFNLTIEDIIIPKICPILGIPLFQGKGKLCSNSPSVDRIDNSKGYTKDNIAIISYRANTLKSNMSIDTVKTILRYMESGVEKKDAR